MKIKNLGLKLRDLIEKAINDCVITNSGYEDIIKMANRDGKVDDHELRLLSQLQGLLENWSLEMVNG